MSKIISPDVTHHGMTRPSVAPLVALIVHGASATARAHLAADEAMQAAATTPTKLDAVVVEDTRGPQLASPKFPAPLRDTPQTIVVIPNTVFQQQGAATLSDVMRN